MCIPIAMDDIVYYRFNVLNPTIIEIGITRNINSEANIIISAISTTKDASVILDNFKRILSEYEIIILPPNIFTNNSGRAYECLMKAYSSTVEPVIPKPLNHEPVIPEPVNHEPVIPEPVIPKPVIAEPVIPEPVIAEPKRSLKRYDMFYKTHNTLFIINYDVDENDIVYSIDRTRIGKRIISANGNFQFISDGSYDIHPTHTQYDGTPLCFKDTCGKHYRYHPTKLAFVTYSYGF